MANEKQDRSRVSHWSRRTISLLLVAAMSFGVFLVLLMVTDARAPVWMKDRIEQRLDVAYLDGKVHLGGFRLAAISNGANPVVTLEQVVLLDNFGQVRARFPEIQAVFKGRDILRGQLNPISINLGRAAFDLVRDVDGRFDIAVEAGDTQDAVAENRSIGDIFMAIREGFSARNLSRLERITSTGVRVRLKDEAAGRTWDFHSGHLEVLTSGENYSADVRFRLKNQDATEAEAGFRLTLPKGEGGASFETRFSGFRAIDLADQVPAFNWLRVVDAPISGALSLEIAMDGTFGTLNGVLDVGAGRMVQGETNIANRFTAAKAYLRYDPVAEKFTFDQILLDTDAAHFVAEGQVYLSDRIDRVVGGIIGQVRFTKAEINPEGVFEKPLNFDLGALDLRVQLDPMIVDIGQLVLVRGEERISLKGQMELGDGGWTSAIDLTAEQFSAESLLAFWPLGLKPKTRSWIAKNIHAGQMRNLTAVARLAPKTEPEVNVGFDLYGANFNFLKNLPPVQDGIGYGVLTAKSFDVVLQSGTVKAPNGSLVNMAGTHFRIPDLTIKAAPAFVEIKTQSTIEALLGVLDLPPFSFLQKAGTTPDLAEGTIAAAGRIDFPLAPKVTFDMVDLSVAAEMRDVRSEKLVKGRILTADVLQAKADDSGLTISGQGHLGGVEISGSWRQDFGPKANGKSRFEGQIEISNAFLEEFNIGLPKGSVSGAGVGHINVILRRGLAPEFTLRSDLNRVGLRLDALGWSKPAASQGSLRASGSFGTPPSIRKLTIDAAGLSASGAVSLRKDGSLNKVSFETVRIDPWLATAITLEPDDAGRTLMRVNGGRADFSKANLGGSGGEGEGGPGLRIAAKLDKLVISSGIALTRVEGDLLTKGGLSGSFAGRVNDGARIVGALAPLKNGTAVRLTSENGGAVLNSAGVFSGAVGGRMDMTLVPRAASGEYDGVMKLKNARVKNATTLANLLSAISVVGLLEQLGGEGILFNDSDAKFRLTPGGVIISESSAVGASLGLTMEGVYHFDDGTMDMRGVITPIYLLNGILEQSKMFGGIFGRKTGEGLFGFNYSIKGPVADPKVGVNPLSILTPGMFRELFRQPPPKPPEATK